MSPYIGEIQVYAGTKPPGGWAFCDGATMVISENDALFTLIGTTYGGDGQETFMLPDLRGRVPVHRGGGLVLGMTGGTETVKLSTEQIPAHNHNLMSTTDPATASTVAGNVPASMPAAGTGSAYGSVAPFHAIDQSSIGMTGGGEAHNNVQPYLCVGYIISLFGMFPSPT
jgi:microcystin-dependent protein